MQLVLCDVCRKNTNKEVPVGTMTRTFQKNPRSGTETVRNQEFVSEILPLTTANDNQERLHICIPCFSNGMTEATKSLAEKSTTPADDKFMPKTAAAVEVANQLAKSGA